MRKKKTMLAPTPDSLANAALAYLGRFAASEAALRRVLENRIRRASILNKEFGQDHDAQDKLRDVIETIVKKHKKIGILNDTAYAETKINSMRRIGRSARAIALKLNQAGVNPATIKKVLAESDGGEGAELTAARELARRRRLGPFRKDSLKDNSPERYRKDLAVLARAGFTLAVARQALSDH